jgi:hypothetical protein
MRAGVCIAICVAAIYTIDACNDAFAAPARSVPQTSGRIGHIQLVEDTCWWWGTRWQYGWRGYGWYPCWDWPKPQPTVISPEAVPEDALTAQPCVRSWRDPSGNWHSRRVC